MRTPWALRAGRLLALTGAAGLLASLFLTWSHPLGPVARAVVPAAVRAGISASPDAFAVYATAGVLLAVLAVVIAAAGLWGQRPLRAGLLLADLAALAFVVHAAATPPTNGLVLATPGSGGRRYFADPATAGAGETLALVALALAAIGLALGCFGRPRVRTTAA